MKVTEENKISNESTSDSSVIDRLNKLEASNLALAAKNSTLEKESKNNSFDSKKNDEIYVWPRKFSYKLYWGSPVLSSKSEKRNKSREWGHVDSEGNENHTSKITVFDIEEWKKDTLLVPIHDFNSNRTCSEKMFPTKICIKYAWTNDIIDVDQDSIDWTDPNNKDWFVRNNSDIVGYKFTLNSHEFMVSSSIIN